MADRWQIAAAGVLGPGTLGGMTDTPHILERDERLSRSLLWRLQRTFFAAQGIEAWRQGIVPHYITSNAFIADAYARVVAAYLGERLATLVDAGQPITIVELGAGSGRFASLFLKRLTALTKRMGPAAAGWRLVMTDLAERNVGFWREHAGLREFVDRGVLDFGRFDVEHDKEIRLVVSGETIGPGTLVNGLIVLGNYFFDGIPLDVFAVEGGQLKESLVTVTSSRTERDLEDPTVLERVTLGYENRPATAKGYYDDPAFNAILEDYQRRLADTSVHFPIAGLRCCKLLRAWSRGQLLMITGDKGYIHDEDLLDRGPPGLAMHGSFSMSVDYHAIAAYFRAAGGQVFAPRHRHDSLLCVGFLLGEDVEGFQATREAFADTIGEFGADDFFSLTQLIEKHTEGGTIAQLLALVRLGLGDPRMLMKAMPALSELVQTASSRDKLELFQAIERTWQLYYHLGEDEDVPFELGRLLYRMDYYPEALLYYGRSLELYGDNQHTLFNMALCHYYLQQRELALECVERVLVLDANHGAARALKIELQAWTR